MNRCPASVTRWIARARSGRDGTRRARWKSPSCPAVAVAPSGCRRGLRAAVSLSATPSSTVSATRPISAEADRVTIERGLRVEVRDGEHDGAERRGRIDRVHVRHSASTGSPTLTRPGCSTPPQTPIGSGSSLTTSRSIPADDAERVEIGHTGVRIVGRDSASSDERLDMHDRRAESRPGLPPTRPPRVAPPRRCRTAS